MYQFLYLFGPGVLAWLAGAVYSHFEEKNMKSIFMEVARVIGYALLDMTVVLIICKPFGRVQFVILADGMLTVNYGVSALLVAVAVAVVIGICGAVIEKHCRRAME